MIIRTKKCAEINNFSNHVGSPCREAGAYYEHTLFDFNYIDLYFIYLISIQHNNHNSEVITTSSSVASISKDAAMMIDNSRGIEIMKDSDGNVIRAFEGIDMKEVYRNKPLSYKFIKRAFDIIASAIGLIVLSPVFLVLAILIKIEDGGPVIFSGQRWGKDLKYFPMHKFRSMCINAEAITNKVISDDDKNGMAFKVKHDPRITKIGHFMRKTSLDELPQLFNVLKGQMSIVGPRPIQTTSDHGDPYDFQRWCVKPGITCYWQVCGRDEVPWDEWVEMDLRYITEMSLWTDLKLLLKTVGAVIGRKGAD